VRARHEPEFILIRADHAPAGLIEDLRANGIPCQTLTRQWPDGEPQDWLRLPREIALRYVDAAAPADS
jgi:hypothetical protein